MPFEPSLFRRPAFWIVQVVGWVVIVLAYWTRPMVEWMQHGLPLESAASTLVLCTFLAIAFSSSLAWAYLTLPERWFARGKAVPVLVASSVFAAVWWTGALYLYVAQVEPGAVAPLPAFYEITLPPLAVMMFAWCALFSLTLLAERTEKARERALRLEALAFEARLRALRAQTNPHFLLNSLSSVVTLIHGDPEKAEQMVHELATLCVRSLDASQKETTTIGEELGFVGLYLRCESVRFEERLEVEVDVPQSLRLRTIQSMLLQPLVENAIKHGLPGTRRLQLVVRARQSADRIVFEVRNTGRLAEPKATESSRLARDVAFHGEGAGLRIIRSRLAAMYPTSGAFELVEEEGWVVARLRYNPGEHHPVGDRVQGNELDAFELPRISAA